MSSRKNLQVATPPTRMMSDHFVTLLISISLRPDFMGRCCFCITLFSVNMLDDLAALIFLINLLISLYNHCVRLTFSNLAAFMYSFSILIYHLSIHYSLPLSHLSLIFTPRLPPSSFLAIELPFSLY